MDNVVEVDKIASGKVNIISFYRKNKLVDVPPLSLRNISEHYKYYFRHHFDGDDLSEINWMNPNIYPFDGGSINDWAGKMKTEFKQMILDGRLDEMYKTKGYSVNFVWKES